MGIFTSLNALDAHLDEIRKIFCLFEIFNRAYIIIKVNRIAMGSFLYVKLDKLYMHAYKIRRSNNKATGLPTLACKQNITQTAHIEHFATDWVNVNRY